MPRRTESPSSINTYKQCPRKYYYTYIAKLPTVSNIHQARGNIAHSVLEGVFDMNTYGITLENCSDKIKNQTQQMLVHLWKTHKGLSEIHLTEDQLKFYFAETLMMLFNWVDQLSYKMQHAGLPFEEAFKKFTPVMREQRFISHKHAVQGFIDAVEDIDGHTRLMDYKTSKHSKITDQYTLQLAIYALLYEEKYGKVPEKVGIYFLKGKEKDFSVDRELIEFARKEVELIHTKTVSDDIEDYPMQPGPLCKWSTGQCDFYELCFEGQTMEEYRKEKGK